jgi:hypothetical protein
MRYALHGIASNRNDSGFVAAFSPQLTTLCYSSYLGGTQGDVLEGIDTLNDGTVLASGLSYSTPIPAGSLVDSAGKTLGRLNGEQVHAVVLELRAPKVCH